MCSSCIKVLQDIVFVAPSTNVVPDMYTACGCIIMYSHVHVRPVCYQLYPDYAAGLLCSYPSPGTTVVYNSIYTVCIWSLGGADGWMPVGKGLWSRVPPLGFAV